MSETTRMLAVSLIPQVSGLIRRARGFERKFENRLRSFNPEGAGSFRNLLHYLAVRQVDLRSAQRDLMSLGLTSLGGMEAHVLATLEAVLYALNLLSGSNAELTTLPSPPIDFDGGSRRLNENTARLFGSHLGPRAVRIMVTMPSEAAADYKLMRGLLAAGMDVMRINCAHDDETAWLGMIANLRRAEDETKRSCKIYADLAGPKLRTGRTPSAGHIVKVRPARGPRGEVVAPAQLWLTSEAASERPPAGTMAEIPVSSAIVRSAGAGDVIRMRDARGKVRCLKINSAHGQSIHAEVDRTTYFEAGAKIELRRRRKTVARGSVGGLPEVLSPIVVEKGDQLILMRGAGVGCEAKRNKSGRVTRPARISCSLDALFDSVQLGEEIWFDDGKIGGKIVRHSKAGIVIRVTYTGGRPVKLRAEKGINLPDTRLRVDSLTEKDKRDLQFIAKHADVVGLSFVRSPADVDLLDRHLARLGGSHLGRVFKIETRQAFERLPEILLAGQATPPVGIMVARGDLAVEVGFERLSEVQEEILWLCEAAHVPVIWATQMLENLARTGSPSRAEVSDAVMSGGAECAMLNKGPFMTEAVGFLHRVLERVSAHHWKKQSTLRRLAVCDLDTPAQTVSPRQRKPTAKTSVLATS